MIYYYTTNELYHYGVKGMKWGVRRTPEQLGHKILKKSKHKNLEKWGKDKKHNTLYILGKSGSGKSTVALSLKDKNTDVIHLDLYTEKHLFNDKNRNINFDKYLKKNYPDYTKMLDKGNWKMLDRFQDEMENFSKEQFKKGRKVIVEGVQLVDETFYPDKSFFKDKPIILTTTNSISSLMRAAKRDGKKMSYDEIQKVLKTSKVLDKKLKDISNQIYSERGTKFIKKYR